MRLLAACRSAASAGDSSQRYVLRKLGPSVLQLHLGGPRTCKVAALFPIPIEATMRTPEGLQPLLDDGIVDEVIRQLKSGKEAEVYVVRCGSEVRCAKVYKDLGQRSFQQRAQYQEGRRTRGSRDARAMAKSTRYGRKEQEASWKNTEVHALYQLVAAGVR